MSKTYLKMKIKSLAAEARLIRYEERKWRGDSATRAGLQSHRCSVVRREARAALLAYGYLRGRPYRALEAGCHKAGEPDWSRIARLVSRFGAKYGHAGADAGRLKAWAEAPLSLAA